MNAVLCFVSDTLDLHFYLGGGAPASLLCPLLELGEIPHAPCTADPYSEQHSVSPPRSVCKIMNSHMGVGDPLLYTLHLSLLPRGGKR